jgi:predicted Fe-Mo cluster-binding NifX family protein
MKIAFTSKGTDWDSQIDPRFGRTEYLLVYDEENDELNSFDNREIQNQAHGAGTQTARKLFELQAKCLVTGNGPGSNAAQILSKTDIDIFIGAGEMNVKEAFDAYKRNLLEKI